MTVRTMVVGCGAVAQRLYRKPLQQLQKQRLLEVVALVDPAPGHAAALQGYFPAARGFAELGEGLTAAKPELALILTPPHLHCEQTLLALAHGSHVLCEKPMAATAADCEKMTAAAAQAQRVLAIGMIRRFFPAYAHLAALIQSSDPRSVHSFEYREGHKFEWAVTTPAAFKPRSKGGAGVLFDIGTHALDAIGCAFGDLAVSSYADDALGGIESNARLEVDSRRGSGSVHLSWDTPQANELRVGTAGGEIVLRVDRFDQLAIDCGSGFVPQPIEASFAADLQPTAGRRISPRSWPEALYAQLVQVLRAVRLNERPAADGACGTACIRLLERALAIAEPLSQPWLEPVEQTANRQLHWRRTGT